MTEPLPFVSVRNISKQFGIRQVLRGVSLDVPQGEAAVILGPSGCGKTTLLRLIAGLDVPDEGEIWLSGSCVAARGRSMVPAYRRGIGFVFQDLALWPHQTVRQHLDFVLASARVPRAERSARIEAVLRMVQIASLAARRPHQLSGGEQQRVAIARAVVGKPRLLLLDEPLASLDPQLRSTLRDELAQLQHQLRTTAVYVTHDLEDARVLADRVVRMHEGQIASADPGDAVGLRRRI